MADSAPHNPIIDLADACVKCGLCLPYCPTYALDGVETESPRGRIALSRHVADGSLAPDADLRAHLDHCLGCMACQRVCPVPVHYGELLTAYRAALPPARPRPRRLLRLLTRPGLLRFGVGAARATGARRWLSPLARLLPQGSVLRAAISLLPAFPEPSRASPTPIKAPSTTHGRVALFGGCIQGALERDAQDAAARLLFAAGYEVVRIDGLCCGALGAHTGDAADAAGKKQRVSAAFAAGKVDALLTATPGCLGTLREDLPGAQVQDAMAFLDLHGDGLQFRPLARKALLHLPCTQVNVARADGAVRRLLARIPGLELDTLPTQGMCCGAAGSHMLEFPERAAALRDRLLGHLPDPAPDLLLTANIGCRLHLGVGLHERGAPMRIQHPLVLLAQQLAP
ncbi:MAG: (Fe-S)-binding protein [Rhodanobacteraceae bacterium]|nr:MAG: (Fe-S)-binding protein [Rhodanobacteraceae bacterium]